MSQAKILIILKKRQDYNGEKHSHVGLSTGLYNSGMFMHEMLESYHVKTKLVVVNDNNDIDREVTKFRPTHVIIEALWVVPTKFLQLEKLHPHVKWIIRLHSEMPFIANEGIAIDWIFHYLRLSNVYVAVNSPQMVEELHLIIKSSWINAFRDDDDYKHLNKIVFLPNFYPRECLKKKHHNERDTIDIGCFGAIRPLKNQLIQAVAAIKFANKLGKKLRFHINAGRVEQKGEPILNNLKKLFENQIGHELVMHEWMPRHEFLGLCRTMDMGLQVSFSETFNIVGADMISMGIPLVGSPEIPWMSKFFTASPTKTDSIYRKLLLTHYLSKINVRLNQNKLRKYSNTSSEIWMEYFTGTKLFHLNS